MKHKIMVNYQKLRRYLFICPCMHTPTVFQSSEMLYNNFKKMSVLIKKRLSKSSYPKPYQA